MRGPKPTPTHLRLIRGNKGKRQFNPAEPLPMRDLPSPPPELNDDAKVEWGRVSEELYRLGLLTKLDRGSLAVLCQSYGRWLQAERALTQMAKSDPETMGLLVKTSNGNPIQNPLVGIANKAMADYMRACAEFGMTPSARTRVRGSHAGDESNPFANLG